MEPHSVVCFGAAHIDRRAHALAAIAPTTSNPVAVTESPGGVARNIAEVLAQLGDQVALVSIVGRDKHGQAVATQLTEIGVDLTNLLRSDDVATATYTALVEPDGHLYVGLADMDIYGLLTPDALADVVAEQDDAADAWFVDANLPPESITWLAARSPGVLAANPVSVPKAPRLRSILDRLSLLVANMEEAEELAGAGSPLANAAALHDLGVEVVAITTHEDGAIVVANDKTTHLDALSAEARDVTGAGDAFMATMLHCLLQHRDPVLAATIALGAAAITVEADSSVPVGLTENAARNRAGLPIEA